MASHNSRQAAGHTKRRDTITRLLDTADELFADSDYANFGVTDISGSVPVSPVTFYKIYPRKASWGAAVLDRRLNTLLVEQASQAQEVAATPHAQLLGKLGLLADAASPMRGITTALAEERLNGRQYGAMVHWYHDGVAQAIWEGQEADVFRRGVNPRVLADFALDSMVTSYAACVDDTAMKIVPGLVVDGLTKGQ